MDGETWRAAVHGVTKSPTRLSDWTTDPHRGIQSPWHSNQTHQPLISTLKNKHLHYSLFSFIALKWKWKWSHSVVSDSLWPHGHRAPLSMGFSRQESWSGLPFPSPGNLPTQGLNPGLPHCRQTLYRLSHQGSNFTRLHFTALAFTQVSEKPERCCFTDKCVWMTTENRLNADYIQKDVWK